MRYSSGKSVFMPAVVKVARQGGKTNMFKASLMAGGRKWLLPVVACITVAGSAVVAGGVWLLKAFPGKPAGPVPVTATFWTNPVTGKRIDLHGSWRVLANSDNRHVVVGFVRQDGGISLGIQNMDRQQDMSLEAFVEGVLAQQTDVLQGAGRYGLHGGLRTWEGEFRDPKSPPGTVRLHRIVQSEDTFWNIVAAPRAATPESTAMAHLMLDVLTSGL